MCTPCILSAARSTARDEAGDAMRAAIRDHDAALLPLALTAWRAGQDEALSAYLMGMSVAGKATFRAARRAANQTS